MRQEVYRVAFDEAKAELTELLGRFEQLRQRKDRIEKVVEALKPLMGNEGQVATPERKASYAAAETPQPLPEPAPQAVPQAVEDSSDPFQRRVDSAVGLGSGARDIREYSRLFNGGSPR